jgi:hypothetical protein
MLGASPRRNWHGKPIRRAPAPVYGFTVESMEVGVSSKGIAFLPGRRQTVSAEYRSGSAEMGYDQQHCEPSWRATTSRFSGRMVSKPVRLALSYIISVSREHRQPDSGRHLPRPHAKYLGRKGKDQTSNDCQSTPARSTASRLTSTRSMSQGLSFLAYPVVTQSLTTDIPGPTRCYRRQDAPDHGYSPRTLSSFGGHRPR